MKLPPTLTTLLLLALTTSFTTGSPHPKPDSENTLALTPRNALSAAFLPHNALALALALDPNLHTHTKRRGGGGRSGSSGGGSRPGSSGSGFGSRPSSSGSGASPNTLPHSNTGGYSSGGSGPRPAYGGGTYYTGGARSPFKAGSATGSGVTPRLLPVAGLGVVGGYGLWHAPIYLYAFPAVHYRNYSEVGGARNETAALQCACAQYEECGCDGNTSPTYVTDLVGNGSYANLTSRGVYPLTVNGSRTLLLNGTLPNGTTAASAAGGGKQSLLGQAGWCAVGAMVVWACFGF